MAAVEHELLIERAGSELIDSSPSRHDSQQLRDQLRQHSYVYLPGLLPRVEVDAVLGDVVESVLANGWVRDESLQPCRPVPVAGEDAYWNAFAQIISFEAVHRLAHHDALLEIAHALIDEPNLVVHPRKIPRLCSPHELAPRRTTPAHQDHPYTQGGVDGIAMWVPLTPAPRERGSLVILDGSASAGICPIRVGGDDYPCVPAELVGDAASSDGWVTTDFEPGDVLVFHALTVHAALPNLTDTMRLSVDFRYRGLSQAIGLTETWPPFHPFLGWWDHYIEGWGSTKWVELPPGARVKGVRPPQRGLDVPASRLVGSPAGKLERCGGA